MNISANSPAAANKIRRGDIRRAVIVRTKQTISRPDGRYLKFDDNAGVLINPKKELLGSRISGVIAQEVRQKGWGKIASVAPKVSYRIYFQLNIADIHQASLNHKITEKYLNNTINHASVLIVNYRKLK